MSVESISPRFFAVVPAAGVGRRMGADQAKQYLPLHDSTVIEQTLSRLLQLPLLEKIVVVVARDDTHWSTLPVAGQTKIVTVTGGAERMHSVLNGLDYLANFAAEEDWVLVHDVARPCILPRDIERLIADLSEHPVGGILAVPVSDTVKEVSAAAITATRDRNRIWLAQTPQMFRLGVLHQALQRGIESGDLITDEASAVELAGLQARVVEGSRSNIKITQSDDLPLAEYYIARQQREGC